MLSVAVRAPSPPSRASSELSPIAPAAAPGVALEERPKPKGQPRGAEAGGGAAEEDAAHTVAAAARRRSDTRAASSEVLPIAPAAQLELKCAMFC